MRRLLRRRDDGWRWHHVLAYNKVQSVTLLLLHVVLSEYILQSIGVAGHKAASVDETLPVDRRVGEDSILNLLLQSGNGGRDGQAREDQSTIRVLELREDLDFNDTWGCVRKLHRTGWAVGHVSSLHMRSARQWMASVRETRIATRALCSVSHGRKAAGMIETTMT